MKNLTLLSFSYLLVALCFGCSDSTKQVSNSESSSTTSKNIKTGNVWADYINLKSDSLSSLYTNESYKILENEKVLQGGEEIKSYYLSDNLKINSIHSDTVIIANKERKLEYEIGEYSDAKNQRYKELVIWANTNTKRKRVFEFTAKIQDSADIRSVIDERRKLWMKLCNEHNAKILIDELYSDSTLYFNHKPLVKGKELLEKEYQYMNKPSYELSLTPIIVETVSNQFVFEIGQCKGSYNGKYILIWRKDKNGKWNIFIDSNI